MESVATDKGKRPQGRPFKEPELLIDSRFSVSFPRERDQELREQAQRHGLNISAFMRLAVLAYLDDLKKAV